MKQITALLMAIMLTLCLLKVKGGDASVVFNLEGGNGVNAVPLTVSLAVNGGISGASVNIIYDYKKVKLAGWEKGAALNCDIISVDDNGFGQLRLVFCASDGYVRGTGELLRLMFDRLPGNPEASFDSVVYVKIDNKAVFDTSYREAAYSSSPGILSFTASKDSFTSEKYTIDIDAGLITDIPPMTTAEEFRVAIGCPVTLSPEGEYITTGTVVTAMTDGVEYICTAVVSGDMNGNGKNDAADYIIVRRIILRMIMPDDIESLAADLNGNGRIDAADYILLRRRIMRQE